MIKLYLNYFTIQSMYFFIKIIFMIIKNFVKIQRGPAFQGNINFALRKTL